MRTSGVSLLCALLLTPCVSRGAAEGPKGMTSQSRIEVLARLAREHPWFREQKAAIVQACEQRLGPSDEDLWCTMPAQCIPRSNSVNTKHGCPTCGDAIHRGYGYYPWGISSTAPWKVQCPKCLERFPKNDFMAYYRSGLDQQGRFDDRRADKGLLHNQEHPDPDDPMHTFGVDPGTGYRGPNGALYTFVACYNGKAYWGQPWTVRTITSDALDFAYAYALTGDRRYARKAAVILSRVATLYPDMDYSFWSRSPDHNPSGRAIKGKILDYIWDNFLVRRLLRTYDLVHDAVVSDPEFMQFLTRKTQHLGLEEGPKRSRFTCLIEQLYLRDVFGCAQNGVLWGNTGMTEGNIALLAVTTRDDAFREEVLRWLFSPRVITGYDSDKHRQHGGGLLDLVLQLSRDGFSCESGGYCEILPKALSAVYPALQSLQGTDLNPVHQAVMSLCRKRLSAYYRNNYAMICLQQFEPYWGDCGNFCASAYPKGVDPTPYFNGYLRLGDPQSARDVKSILAAGGKGADDTLRIDDLYFIPPDIHDKLETFAGLPTGSGGGSVNLTGRGLVVLKQGDEKAGRSLWTHYGNNHTCHNHPDTLTIGLFAFGRDVLPSLGYPDLKQRNTFENWHLSAICNNTIVVDGQEQMQRIEIGDQKLFAESELLSAYAIDASALYEQCSTYRRCVGLVNVSDDAFYVVDFFDVEGGREHVYSFHSGEGELTPDPSLAFTRQESGTYAGTDVEYGQESYRYSPEYKCRWGNGFHFLYDVARSGPAEESSFTWSLKNTHGISPFGDDVRCRLNLPTPTTEVAIAKGQPPQNTKGNPEYIHYVLAKRGRAEGTTSQFAGVIETYLEGRRPVTSVRRLRKLAGGPFASALEVRLADGRTDLIVKGADESSQASFEGGLSLKGFLCLLRLDADGEVIEYHVSMVHEVSLGTRFRMSFVPSAASEVLDFEKGVTDSPTVSLSESIRVPEEALRPLWADISPAHETTDGSYRVLDVQDRDGRTMLHLDSDSFIASAKDKSVFGKTTCDEAFEYAFARGARVVIPFSYHGRPRR